MKRGNKQEIILRQAPRIPRILIPIILIIVLGVAFVFTAKPLFNLDLGISILKTSASSTSEAVLMEVKDIFQFNTVEYVYKTVFPYDFVPGDYGWAGLLLKSGRGEPLNGEETELLSIYRFCESIGIKIDSNQYDFAVVTCIVKGGYDLSGTLYEQIQKDKPVSNIEDYILIDEENNRIRLRLPEPSIVNVIIEDSTNENYQYPALAISPENWKILTNFVAKRIREKVIGDGILETAASRAKEFISQVLIQSGYSSVEFIEPAD